MMRWVLLLAILSSCATKQNDKGAIKAVKKTEEALVMSQDPLAITIKPGETRSLVYHLPTAILKGKLVCDKKDTPFNIINNKLRAFISESYFSQLKPYTCVWQSQGKLVLIARVSVEKKDFPKEQLTVDRKRVWPSKKNQARAKRERDFKNKAYSKGSKYPLFDEPFELPIDSIETSIYGTQRVYNKKKKGQHLGTDFRAAVGTPIRSSNSGKVIVSRDFFYTGYTIIVDHGLDIFTIYAHLSELMVNEGDRVLKGQVIGLAGATGRVTGPHLHWGVKVNEMAIEGHSLISASTDFVEKK